MAVSTVQALFNCLKLCFLCAFILVVVTVKFLRRHERPQSLRLLISEGKILFWNTGAKLRAQFNGTSDALALTPDGLLSHDKEDVVERVAYLEKKVQQQEDEIVCLKSAMADVIRRLGSVEISSQNHALPSSSSTSRGYRALPSRPRSMVGGSSSSKSHLNALDNVNVMSQRNAPNSSRSSSGRSSRMSSAHTLSKWSSLSTSAEMSNSMLTPTSSRGKPRDVQTVNVRRKKSKEPFWNQEDGFLKIYIRGRGVSLYASSNLSEYNINKTSEVPPEKLQLEWVYGYRGRDCRSNLYYLPTGEVVYFTAAVVVLHNPEEQTQRHYLGHTDDIKCIAIHPDKIKIATGQVAGHDAKEGKVDPKRRPGWKPQTDQEPHVRVWDSVSLNTLHVIGIGCFSRAVCCLSFSKLDGGQQLVVVDEANEHIISVWDLGRDKPHKLTETKSSTEPVLAVEFHPSEKGSIVSCGKGQITFWTLEGGALVKKHGIFDKYDKPKYVLSLAFSDSGDVLSGDSNGSIFVWGKGSNRITQAMLNAHDGGVFSLCVTKDGTLLSGGGKDRKIIQWDNTFAKTGSETEVPESYGPVRTLSQGKGGLVLVGTTRNCILSGSLDLELSVIVQSHTDEMWGLASHPTQHQFLTCGSDKQLYLWDSQSRTVVWNKEMNDAVHSCCFHPRGGIVAVGTSVARWLVLDLSTHEIVSVHTDGNEQIECIQYSPDGSMLAVGSRDNYIYIYQVSDDAKKYTKVGRCSGHSSFITHVDWSEDSQYLASNSGDYELLYWTASSCKQLTNPAVIRELKWATQSCVLGFNTAGIWPDGADGTDVNGCCKSHNERLVASCDDFGKVNLYSYPCCQPKSNCHSYKGHSSHVTSVTFLFDDSRLISTGGKDTAVMQWQVV
ncbi:echinoderm microtubule-associated protein-like 2 [Aplysia californica]|uniref:Echinoderm microtubule-associated protein-like 2 n=1 Tax=Aplysia californica TaxID=6500 RepID=A0ABM1VQL3_APLCA|nr:echinoderm microtubule-associated protein-like 2 [Aplysia californica]